MIERIRTNEQLESCPYCDSAVKLYGDDGEKIYFVRCGSCHARGPEMASAAAAVRYWNRGFLSVSDRVRGGI